MSRLTKVKSVIFLILALSALACASPIPPPSPTPAPTAIPVTQSPVPTPTSIPPTPALESNTPFPTSTPLPTTVPLPAVAPEVTGQAGGLLRVAGFAGVPHRDVHQSVQETLASLGPGLAYSRLLKLQSGAGSTQPSLLLECDLCLSWELTAGFAYEFQLNPDVKWQNIAPVDGRPLVADDLVYSYNRLRTTGWPNAGLLSSFGQVEALGAHTLRINLEVADADALLSLADGHSKIVAHEVVEQYGDLRDSPVIGTGPWVWMESETGSSASTILRRNPDYFEQGLPFLDRLEFMAFRPSGPGRPPDRDRLAAFQGGLVDMALMPPMEWQQLKAANADVGSALSKQGGAGVMLSMNVQAPPLDDLTVRRAILRAMDPWNYVDTLWPGQGFVSLGIPVQDTGWLLERDEMRGGHFADPGMAREMVAGVSSAVPVDIELTVRTEAFGQIYRDLEQRVAEDLRQIGFNPIVRRLNPIQFNEAVLEHKEYQLALGVLPPTSTTNSFLMALLHSAGRWNISGHQDAALDAMIEAQASEFDPDQRREQLKNIQRRVLDQAYLFSPVGSASRWVYNRNVKGFYPNTALSEYLHWSRVWLDR